MKPLKEIIDKKLVGKLDLSKFHLNYRKDVDYNIITNLFKTNPRVMYDLSPCLITTPNDYKIYELKRNFTIEELLQLQGFPKNFKQVVSKTQMIKQIGNSMSVNVLKYIIKEILTFI